MTLAYFHIASPDLCGPDRMQVPRPAAAFAQVNSDPEGAGQSGHERRDGGHWGDTGVGPIGPSPPDRVAHTSDPVRVG